MVKPSTEDMQQQATIPMNHFPIQSHQHIQQLPCQFSSALQLNFNSQQQPPIEPDNLDRFMSAPFTSFTALLTEGLEEDDHDIVSLKSMHEQIEQDTKAHNDQVKNMLFEIYGRHYNNLVRTVKKEARRKLKEKDEQLAQARTKIVELQQTIHQLTYQGQFWQTRIMNLERRILQNEMLREALTVGSIRPEEQQEDAESCFVDPNREEPVNMGPCRACNKAEAKAIIWPCRHICVCIACAATVNFCPVCHVPKFNTYELVLP